jgi:hypothetical protein
VVIPFGKQMARAETLTPAIALTQPSMPPETK